MKRSWIGLGLLILLLVLSIVSAAVMLRIHEAPEAKLNWAADYAMERDWMEASRYFDEAQQDWDRWAHFRACFADHNPVEEIDALLKQAESYRVMKENAAFAAACRELARKVAAVGEAHELVWWNLL